MTYYPRPLSTSGGIRSHTPVTTTRSPISGTGGYRSSTLYGSGGRQTSDYLDRQSSDYLDRDRYGTSSRFATSNSAYGSSAFEAATTHQADGRYRGTSAHSYYTPLSGRGGSSDSVHSSSPGGPGGAAASASRNLLNYDTPGSRLEVPTLNSGQYNPESSRGRVPERPSYSSHTGTLNRASSAAASSRSQKLPSQTSFGGGQTQFTGSAFNDQTEANRQREMTRQQTTPSFIETDNRLFSDDRSAQPTTTAGSTAYRTFPTSSSAYGSAAGLAEKRSTTGVNGLPPPKIFSTGLPSDPAPRAATQKYDPQAYDSRASSTQMTSNSAAPPVRGTSASSYALYNPEPNGFRNLGNTCYINATLQCVVAIHPFLAGLAQCVHSQPGSKHPVTRDVVLLGEKNGKSQIGVLLGSIKKQLGQINPEFAGYGQSDAHEFLRTLFLQVHNEVNMSKGKYREMKDQHGETDEEAANRWYAYHMEHDSSFMYDTFGGMLKTVTVCSQCRYRSLSFDPFLDLSLSMSKEDESLLTLFTRFTSKESLSGTNCFKCPQCKRGVEAHRRQTVQFWPEHLCLHLKRFNARGGKNPAQVMYSNNLSVDLKWTSKDNDLLSDHATVVNGGELPTYSLCGIVCHSGSTSNFGHYYAYVNMNDRWYCCDDGIIRDCTASISRVIVSEGKTAYMLFYRRTSGSLVRGAQ